MKHEYIKKIFTQLKKLKDEGIYLSGIEKEGEYKQWYDNGKLSIDNFYKNGKEIKMPDNIRDGYILVDGKYYPDEGDIQ